MNKHEFALYCDEISNLVSKAAIGEELIIEEKNIVYRAKNVLRFNSGDIFIIFDRKNHFVFKFLGFIKKKLNCIFLDKKKNIVLKPKINFILPILAKKDFEDAIYSLSELGANNIYLAITQKVKRAWKDKELERINKIIISAAEQSKNFVFPNIFPPQNLQFLLKKIKGKKIFFDAEGKELFPTIEKIKKDTPLEINLMIGPEADLNKEEKDLLLNNDFIFVKLTPTILRAYQATAIALGVFRSLL